MRGDINWEGKSILVVEDDHINYSYLDIVLKSTRARVLHAIEGQQAINLCREHPEINVVLMDIRLPGMNGLDATKHITALRNDLPVIAQTAYATEDDQAAAFSAGCRDFIAKPIRANDMINMIRKYLEG
jgi:CheY-like chemotaxis protein